MSILGESAHSTAAPPGHLAVLLPFRLGGAEPRRTWRLNARHGVILATLLTLSVGVAQAQTDAGQPSILATILKWTPLLAQGFALNIAMSFLAMAIGTVLGFPLGLGQVSVFAPVRRVCWLVTQFFRNAPWLVLLFYVMLLMPFEIRIGSTVVSLPGWLKSTIGLSLPVMANVSELVRGRGADRFPTASGKPRNPWPSPVCRYCGW